MKTGYKVADAMTINPISVSPDMTLLECARVMSEKHVGTVVVKDNEHSLGILTEQDIVRKKGLYYNRTTTKQRSGLQHPLNSRPINPIFTKTYRRD